MQGNVHRDEACEVHDEVVDHGETSRGSLRVGTSSIMRDIGSLLCGNQCEASRCHFGVRRKVKCVCVCVCVWCVCVMCVCVCV